MSAEFKSALEKARAVAAKLGQGLTPAVPTPIITNPNAVNYTQTINNNNPVHPINPSNGSGIKRQIEDDDDDTIVGNLKKMAYSNTSLASSDKSGISRPPLPSNRALQNIEPMPTAGGRTKNGNTIFKPTSIYLDGTIQNGEKILDIMVPGQKVGFIIGKGGDMIRQLQERANVKMTIIQQSSEVTDNQKQLRIVGDPNKVDIAQQLVKDLLVEKEMEMLKYKNKPDRNNHHNSHSNHSNHNSEYGGSMGGSNYLEIPVSPQFIGLVIGKSGENIKRISHETGAKVVVDVQKTDSTGNKLCQISAMNPNQLNMAAEMVRDILNNAMNNKRGGGRGGRDNDSMHAGGEEVKIQVPHNKTGIIIGKGGENIRALKQQCGCQIELEKNSKGIFYIRGSVDRVQYAQQVLSEKIGGNITVLSSTIQSNPQAAAAAAAAAYTDPYWAASQAQFAYPQMQPNAGAAAATNSASQDNVAAWQAYYQQYYQQVQMAQQQQQLSAGAATPAGVPAAAAATASAAGAAATAQAATAAPAAAGADGQADYSEQWAAYYRYYGMEKEAEMYEAMAKQKKAAQQAAATNSSTCMFYNYPYHNVPYPPFR